MKQFKADLHIHTVLSPCCGPDMTPLAVVRAAALRGMDLIAIADHNAAGNVAAAQEAAGEDVAVLAGMEITTAEEVHVLALFRDAPSALAAADEVKATLPETGEVHRRLGNQFLMDAQDRRVGREARLLTAASSFTLSRTVELIRAHGGLAVAAHVDRMAFGVIGHLGFIPEDVRFDAIEVSAACAAVGRQKEFLQTGLPILVSSDSHFLAEVGTSFTVIEMQAPTFGELVLALQGRDGRICRHA